MNKVECHVSNCQHYSNDLCSLDKISVDGPAAKEKSQTCCLSFDEKISSAENVVGYEPQASVQTNISCKATNCGYNSNKRCEADSIRVSNSMSNATSKSGTQCATFSER